MSLFQRHKKPRGTRIFFATDIHGSEECFRKFLAAPRFYDADVLILGGDIIGKSLIPIVERSGSYAATLGERTFSELGSDGLQELITAIRRSGDYFVVGSPEELERLSDPAELDRVFRSVVYKSIEEWVALAEERLEGSGVKCFVAPGNDDFLEVDSALKGGRNVLFAEGEVLRLDDTHEVLTTGYSNVTPWATEREFNEDEMAEYLQKMADRVADIQNAVAVIHPPPYDSTLDLCPAIDDEFRPQMQGGTVTLAPVGSTAVRKFIEDYEPLVGLHGHVHEGKGMVQLGGTLCLNPGSEYSSGILSGALLALGEGEVISRQFVSG